MPKPLPTDINSSTITDTAFAFRGYNTTNLGRTRELLEISAYAKILETCLQRASEICVDITGLPTDLLRRVQQNDEPTLAAYPQAVALIVAVEIAQVQLLEEIHGVAYANAKLAYGYSLGELTAITCGGVLQMHDMLQVPLAMAADSVGLAADVTMGVLFSRGPAIHEDDVCKLCLQITAEGTGTIGISAILSPNTYLLLGQRETVQRFRKVMHDRLPDPAHLRLNNNRWPPLHTPIVRQRNIPDRASVLMETMDGGFQPPCPPVLSLATGKRSYDDHHARSIIRRWIDHPQRLWDAVCETLSCGVKTVIHVGPEPNVIPATFRRLSDNINEQTTGGSLGSLGMRAVAGLARRPWLSAILPAHASLLRAPTLKHVILEDWLIENAPE